MNAQKKALKHYCEPQSYFDWSEIRRFLARDYDARLRKRHR